MDLKEVLLKRFRESSEADDVVLSDRTILDTIELSGLPEEDKVDEFVEKLTPLFKTVAGQSRFVLSKAKEEKEKELERIKQETNIPDGGVPPVKEDQKNPSNKEELEKKDELLNKLLANVDSLSKEIANMKTNESLSNRQSKLKDYAENLGLSDKYVLKQAISKVDLTKDNFEEVKEELYKTYISEYKDCRDMDAPTIGSNGGKDASSSFLDSMFEQKKSEAEYYKPKFD